MDQLPPVAPRPDTTGWPIIDAVPSSGVYLGPFDHDCWPNLTAEQKTWPIIDALPPGAKRGLFDEDGNRIDIRSDDDDREPGGP